MGHRRIMDVFAHMGIFLPEELDFLDAVFHEACRRYGVTPSSTEGEVLAETIILHYQLGLRDYNLLLSAAVEGMKGAA